MQVKHTMYVPESFFLILVSSRKNYLGFRTSGEVEFLLENCNGKLREITISWEQEPTKYTLTSDEIFALVADWYAKSGSPEGFKKFIEQRLDK